MMASKQVIAILYDKLYHVVHGAGCATKKGKIIKEKQSSKANDYKFLEGLKEVVLEVCYLYFPSRFLYLKA